VLSPGSGYQGRLERHAPQSVSSLAPRLANGSPDIALGPGRRYRSASSIGYRSPVRSPCHCPLPSTLIGPPGDTRVSTAS
jgi:hypothetical protein